MLIEQKIKRRTLNKGSAIARTTAGMGAMQQNGLKHKIIVLQVKCIMYVSFNNVTICYFVSMKT